MSITILYFGELREQLNLSSESLVCSDKTLTVQSLLDQLIAKGDPWASALTSPYPLQVAVNQEMADQSTIVAPDAEVALFRPVTGG